MSYPFSALVGQPLLTTALLVGAVDPRIGGVLVRGHKGTAKSTAVRALAALLPPIEVTVGCPYHCPPDAPADACTVCTRADRRTTTVRTPLVELPVGADEDRVVGTVDLERALSDGVRSFQPGLLARAHRGVLYVDEVNLLDDHLVDVLLDAAATGVHHVEREGVSVTHPAQFPLVGTMNPEEGELRPQLLDRFGLTVEVTAPADPAQRAEVVRRRLAYEADPAGFAARYADQERALAARLADARDRRAHVTLAEGWLTRLAQVCAGFDVDGLRADIVAARTAVALAAWHGRSTVVRADVRTACLLALPHRRRRGPFDDPGLDEDELDRLLGDDDPPDPPAPPEPPEPPDPPDSPESPESPEPGDAPDGDPSERDPADGDPTEEPPRPPPSDPADPDGRGGTSETNDPETRNPRQTDETSDAHESSEASDGATSPAAGGAAPEGRVAAADPASGPPPLLAAPDRRYGATGRRSRGPARRGARGRTRTYRPGERVRGSDLALAATLRAAACRAGPAGMSPQRGDLRRHERRGRQGHLIVLCVDASGSMGARQRMAAVKGAVRALLTDAYQRRDLVALVTFRGEDGQVALPPTAGVERADRHLADLPTGGRTPLAAGLQRAGDVVARHARRDPERRPLLVVVTDGRSNAGPDAVGATRRAAAHLAGQQLPALVVDTEQGFVRTGLAADLAARLSAPCVALDAFHADGLARTIRLATGAAGASHASPTAPRRTP